MFEGRLLGGTVSLLCIGGFNSTMRRNGEISTVFFPHDGPYQSQHCLFTPSFISDFLKKPRKPVCEQDYTMMPTTEVAVDITLVSGHRVASCNALHQFPARQTEPTTPTKQSCRLHKGFAAPYKQLPGLCMMPHGRNLLRRKLLALKPASSK